MKKQPELTEATKAAVLNAFWEIYQQRSVDRITVRDIADSAHIHRSTFYRYFTDIYDVLNQFEQKIFDEISAALESLGAGQGLLHLVSHSELMVSALKDHAPVIYHLTSSSGDPAFHKKLRELMRAYFSRFSSLEDDSLKAEYLFNFAFTNILANLNFWYEHRNEYTLEQIVAQSKVLVSEGIASYLKLNEK